MEINPEEIGGFAGRAACLLVLQRYEEALQAFDRALEINPEHADTWNLKGVALVSLQRYEEALQAFDRALEINPEHAGARHNKGVALYHLQRYEEALQAFERVTEINPEHTDAWLGRGEVHLEISKLDFKQNNHGNALENLNTAMDSFLEIWDTKKEEIRDTITDFFKNLTDSGEIEAVGISLETVLKKKSELAEFLKPISVSLDIIRTKDLKKYYNLQVEERDLVVDIVKKLTGSEDLVPEEYRKSGSF